MMTQLNRIAKTMLPPTTASMAKQVAAYPRYLQQRYQCRQGYWRHGAHYPQKMLFVAGLPKSGTTWLEQMLAAYPGFHPLMHPAAVHYERMTGGSHDYDLPADYFSRFCNMLVVNKMHVHGSLHNVRLLDQATVRYVILYRDLRDVAVSYFFYVRHTPWHPEYRQYVNLSPEQGLRRFAERLLPAYVKWIQSWHENRNPTQSLMIRYEEMVHSPVKVMTDVARLFEVNSACDTIQSIVNRHHFARLSHGRQPGEQQAASFFRKGVVGDWKTYFTPAVTDLYKQHIGSFLIDYEYESDNAW